MAFIRRLRNNELQLWVLGIRLGGNSGKEEESELTIHNIAKLKKSLSYLHSPFANLRGIILYPVVSKAVLRSSQQQIVISLFSLHI